jgi:hypothetical protein
MKKAVVKSGKAAKPAKKTARPNNEKVKTVTKNAKVKTVKEVAAKNKYIGETEKNL